MGDAVQHDKIKGQKRRAARLAADATERRTIDAILRIHRDLDQLLSLIDAREPRQPDDDDAWARFIRAQIAVATWQLDALEHDGNGCATGAPAAGRSSAT